MSINILENIYMKAFTLQLLPTIIEKYVTIQLSLDIPTYTYI